MTFSDPNTSLSVTGTEVHIGTKLIYKLKNVHYCKHHQGIKQFISHEEKNPSCRVHKMIAAMGTVEGTWSTSKESFELELKCLV